MRNYNPKFRLISNRFFYLFLAFILSFSCRQQIPSKSINSIKDSIATDNDSLVKVIFDYNERYFNIHSVDSLIALIGNPVSMQKKPWGENQESLLIVEYPFLIFKFLENTYSSLDLESIILLDKRITLGGYLSIGKSTRQNIIKTLGLPDLDHNDPGRSMNKFGDTTVYGTQSGAGDTVSFVYTINIDESISFSMTKDTLRKVSWTKNMD
jgi:hypothetical protein